MESKVYFWKVLSFTKEKEKMISFFTDKFGKGVEIITDWTLVPDLRYNCKIEFDKVTKSYELISSYIFSDKLRIEKTNIVQVFLEEEPVECLIFNPKIDPDYSLKIEELKSYFRNHTFQLKNKGEISSFIKNYRELCEQLFEQYTKKQF